MRQRRRPGPTAEDSFSVRNLAEFMKARTEVLTTLSYLLAATSVISLIVGGIGIMNIMLVSVTERTREIGLRMAVGGRRRDILMQFLVEAVTLCLLGGLIGVAIGVTASAIVAFAADWPVLVSPSVLVLGHGRRRRHRNFLRLLSGPPRRLPQPDRRAEKRITCRPTTCQALTGASDAREISRRLRASLRSPEKGLDAADRKTRVFYRDTVERERCTSFTLRN